MSIEAMTWALSVDVGSATRKLVLIGYANHAHRDGRNAWAGKETIADYVNVDERTVRRQVAQLIAGGWIRLGDQHQVDHVRPDRRPVVYDLALTEAQRSRWAAAQEAGDSSFASEHRGDPWWHEGSTGQPVPPIEAPRPDTAVSPRQDVHGGTNGGTETAERGDIAVSPEPSRTLEPSPQPPAERGAQPTCQRPGPTPHANCRGCETSNRQLAERARRDTADRERADEQAAWRARTEEQRARAVPPEVVAAKVAASRAQLTTTSRRIP